jgi:pyruvate,water dikinase
MYVHWLHEISHEQAPLVGGKGANLARLTQLGIPVPPGFCISMLGYQHFIVDTGLARALDRLLTGLDTSDLQQLSAKATDFQQLFLTTNLPSSIAEESIAAYQVLGIRTGVAEPQVAVRSSGTAEDMASASFAGQHDSYMNVRGKDNLADHLKRCWASLWNSHAIYYRHTNHIDHQQVSMAVVVQQMVHAASAGVMFTANPVTGDKSEIIINATWGLGESVVSGMVEPDTIILDKRSTAIKTQTIGLKESMIQPVQGFGTEVLEVPSYLRQQAVLNTEEVSELVRLALKIEEWYGAPQDIEWASDANGFFILQSRPVTGLPAPGG